MSAKPTIGILGLSAAIVAASTVFARPPSLNPLEPREPFPEDIRDVLAVTRNMPKYVPKPKKRKKFRHNRRG